MMFIFQFHGSHFNYQNLEIILKKTCIYTAAELTKWLAEFTNEKTLWL